MFTEDKFKCEFKLENEDIKLSLYIPFNTTTYHTSRLQEAMRQNMYASSGITEDTLAAHLDAMETIANQNNKGTIATDLGTIINALRHRMKYPVDAHCGVRMGIALTFIEYQEKGKEVIRENPDKVEYFFMQKKEELAFQYPELYDFFLSLGVTSIARYREVSSTLNVLDYLLERSKKIREILNGAHSQLYSN